MDQPATVAIALVNALPGRWDEARVPVRRLTIEARGRPDDPGTLDLPALDVELGNGTRPAGQIVGRRPLGRRDVDARRHVDRHRAGAARRTRRADAAGRHAERERQRHRPAGRRPARRPEGRRAGRQGRARCAAPAGRRPAARRRGHAHRPAPGDRRGGRGSLHAQRHGRRGPPAARPGSSRARPRWPISTRGRGGAGRTTRDGARGRTA